ncbi:MAG: hypothetical protein ACR2F1_00415 [Nitrososphaeraceae archaeon]
MGTWGTCNNLLNPNKNEKFSSNFSDRRGDLINKTKNNLLSFTPNVNNNLELIQQQNEAIQRSIALVNKNFSELIDLLENNKIIDRERRFY